MKVMIVAAGTGGHVFPGIAVAQCLQASGVEVVWLGSRQGREQGWVRAAGFAFHAIAVSGLRGKGLLGWLAAPWRVLRAFWQAWQLLRAQRPDLVLAMGGYVCGPAGVAARLLGIPLWLHEQNARAGLTNRLLAPMASRILLGLPLQMGGRLQQRGRLVGNPLRAGFVPGPAPLAHAGPLRVLVLGGSQGARFLNELLPAVLGSLPVGSVQVWHQTGDAMCGQVQQAYAPMGDAARVSAFIEDMPSAYAWADVVVARAGALTVAELSATARPALLVPLPQAVDDHQSANAQVLVSAGAARLMPQASLSHAVLLAHLQQLQQHPEQLLNMWRSGQTQAGRDAAGIICEQINGALSGAMQEK